MKTIVYEGGAGTVRSYVRFGQAVMFEIGKPVEVDDDFADELLAQNSTGLSAKDAWIHSIPVFKQVTKGSAPKSASEEVGT